MSHPCPVVGVGASSGGLAALSELFGALPADTGMTFLVVQHLDPTHPSQLAEILGRVTKMKVAQVTDGETLLANHVYVAAAHVVVCVAGDQVKVTAEIKGEGQPFLPVDSLFQSLAATCNDDSIGIVLSGTGRDGVVGLGAIKAAGGTTFAQDADSAKEAAMPVAAAALGLDFVLPPAGIARELVRIAASMATARACPESDREPEMDSIEPIIEWLRTARGTNFQRYKRATLERRIRRRMGYQNIMKSAEYLIFVREHPVEADVLYEDILIKVTSFFRDPEVFARLESEVLRQIVESKAPGMPIKIWVPGCATGEEAYSIAICLAEVMGDMASSRPVQIFATDVSATAIAAARSGHFGKGLTEAMPAQRLNRHFISHEGGYRINKSLREMCVFATQDVTKDPPFSRLDLISCRNLLIYFDLALQRRVLTTFHFSLAPRGVLFLGNSESVGRSSDLFEASGDKGGRFYTRLPVPTRAPDFASEYLADKRSTSAVGKADVKASYEDVVRADAGRALISKWGLNGVVVDQNMEILQVLGQTSDYLMHPSGEMASFNLFRMAPKEALLDLRLAVHEASMSGAAARTSPIAMSIAGIEKKLLIEVVPYQSSETGQRCSLVLFEDAEEKKHAPPSARLGSAEDGQTSSQLVEELAETRTHLNTLLEKEQAANEELKSASEEILSSNEELQSTNQELQTAKEEIQATNEELQTVNDELRSRNKEMTQVHSDLSNTLSSAQVAIVILSDELKCRRLTPTAGKVLKLHGPQDGMSLDAVMKHFAGQDWVKLVRGVTATLVSAEVEVQDLEGHWYQLRVRPYRTVDNRIDGAVLVFDDIEPQKRKIKQLETMD